LTAAGAAVARRHLILLAALLALGACSVRSISNSGPPGERQNDFYRGELAEIDVLTPDAAQPISDERIRYALNDGGAVRAELGRPLMVIQSGALEPDREMAAALEPVFRVVPFSGIPAADRTGYARRLRLAAAEGGYRRILVYWGQLEAASQGTATKAVSWVPIVGMLVPDESQHMRIHLKAVIIDVASGRWRFLTPEPVEDERLSAGINRRTADQDQVTRLKSAGYAALARALIEDAAKGVAEARTD
jgi:hypothetical protein